MNRDPPMLHFILSLVPASCLLQEAPPFSVSLSLSVPLAVRPSVFLSFFLSLSFFHRFCFLFYFFDCFYFLNKLFLCFFFDCFCFRVLHDIEQSLAASVVSSSSTCQIFLLPFGLLLLVVKLVVESSCLCSVFFYLLWSLFGCCFCLILNLFVLELVEQELGDAMEGKKERGAMGGKADRKPDRSRKMKTEPGASTAATNHTNGSCSLAMHSAHKLVRSARGRSLLIHL
jgi:hypothetical protein